MYCVHVRLSLAAVPNQVRPHAPATAEPMDVIIK